MTSVAVPDNDLAPNLPSREVTISATNVTEGGVSLRGQWVNFALSDSIDVTPGGDMIAKTSQTITLDSAGNGRIRLPVYDTGNGKGWESGKDWAIIVTTSWGSSKAIRVPQGSGSIPLSYLPAVRPLTRAETKYAVSGVSISVGVGSTPGQASGTATLDGGIIRLGLTVPPTGPHTHPTSDITGLDAAIAAKAFNQGALGTSDLDAVTDSGQYTQAVGGNATTARNYPVTTSGTLTVTTVSSTTWQIYEADAAQGTWKRKKSGSWSDWTRIASTFINRGLIGSADLDDVLAEGIWHQPYSSGATTALHYPVTTSGVLTVTLISTPNTVYQTYQADSGYGLWRRVRSAYRWSDWERITSTITNRGSIGSADLDDLLEDGTYFQRYSGNALAERHYPTPGYSGQLEVRVLDAAIGTRSQEWIPTQTSQGRWRRVSQGSVWPAWENIASASVPVSSGDVSEQRMTRLSVARKRLLGGPGTSGQAAVSFRFDDGHAAFDAKIAPLLRQHGLPAFVAVSERYLDDSAVSNATVQGWALTAGVEITAHSRNHSTESGAVAIRDSIVTWADDLQSRVGQVIVDTWTFPGGGDFDGLAAGTNPWNYPNTYAGRCVLERYAAPYGGSAGWLSPLSGEPTIGQSHVTIEAYSLAQVQDTIRQAQDSGMGVVLMLHPEKLDTAGFMTTATLGQVFAWAAGEREAGRLSVLTGTGLALAHTGTPASLVPRLSSWTGSGWSTAAERSTTGTTALTAAVTINGYAGSRGAPVELSIEVQGESGAQVQLGLSGGVLSMTRTVTLPDTGWRRIYAVATIPSGLALGTDLTASVRQIASGTLTVRAPRLSTI